MDKMNFFTELSEDDKLRQADKEFFIQYNHVECGGDKSIVEFIATTIASIVTSIVMIVCNIIYFKKRKHLFIN